MIRFLSWNIQWGRGADGLVNMSRVIDEIRRLGEFDVICLQEVAVRFPGLKGGVEEDGIAVLAHAFPDHEIAEAFAVDRAHPAGGRSRFGNVILSRWRIDAIARHRLPSPPDPKHASMARSVVEAVVSLPGGRSLRVLTTHLEYYSAVQRSAQVARLCQLQQDALDWLALRPQGTDEEGPFARPPWPAAAIVCGDFNCKPGSAQWSAMQAGAQSEEGVWFDAWTVRHGERPHPHSVGLHGAEWPDHPYCCDYFFASAAAVPAIVDVRYDDSSAASDHQPVMLDVDEAAL